MDPTPPVSRLSLHPELDRPLRELAREAVAWVHRRSAQLGPRPPLLLVLGSGASGEAAGVTLGSRILPLSDLDLGLFLDRGPSAAEAQALRADLAAHLRPVVEGCRLTGDPVDLGIYDLGFVRRMPPTLELCEAGRAPRVLLGDPAPLRALGARPPAPFEAVRLALNRLVEDCVARGDAAGAGRLPASASAPEAAGRAGVPAPDASAWRAAYRGVKLPADLLKALLAARGTLVPALADRLPLVSSAPASEALAERIRWRLQPQWPPPAPLPPATTAALVRAVLSAACEALGIAPWCDDRPAGWRALLACESGPERERWRRWQRMVAARPPGIGWAEALGLVLRWAPGGAWPASVAAQAFGAAWLRQQRAEEGAGGPTDEHKDADAGRGAQAVPAAGPESALTRATGMVHWARSAGA